MKNFPVIKLALLALTLTATAQAKDKVIFGADDRVELYEVPARYRQAADSTVSLWRKSNLRLDPSFGGYRLQVQELGKGNNLCPGTRFEEQPAGAFCSGALVGEDLVVTAGHCVRTEQDCANTAFVFGFAVDKEGGAARTAVDAGEVYGCAKIIKRDFTYFSVTTDDVTTQVAGPDYALIKLDHKVSGHKPLGIDRVGAKKGDRLFMTGHPIGLPFKFSYNASVIKPVQEQLVYFHTDLDAMGGNSGSPVFNAETGLITGIHVRSETHHLIPTFEGCNVYTTRPDGVGRGGEATKIGLLADYIPPTAEEAAAQNAANTAVTALRAGVPPLGKTAYFEPRNLITY